MPWWAWLLIGFAAGIVITYAAIAWAVGSMMHRVRPSLSPPKDSPNGQS